MGSLSQIEDQWQRRATAAAIASARNVVGPDGLNGKASVGSLSDTEWGWIVCAVIFGWITVRAQQAVSDGSPSEITIRTIGGADPEPWRYGAIESILPGFADIPGLDWEKPLAQWSKKEIITMLHNGYRLVDAAIAAQAETDRFMFGTAEKEAREISAANGGGLYAPGEELEAALFP